MKMPKNTNFHNDPFKNGDTIERLYFQCILTQFYFNMLQFQCSSLLETLKWWIPVESRFLTFLISEWRLRCTCSSVTASETGPALSGESVAENGTVGVSRQLNVGLGRTDLNHMSSEWENLQEARMATPGPPLVLLHNQDGCRHRCLKY